MAIWKSDAAHSEVSFKVKHLMITNVKGVIRNYEAEAVTDSETFTPAKISFTADAASIDTGSEQRDQHLQSPEFFDAASFPKITFSGTSFEKKSDEQYELTGDLTIRGVTKPVKLDVEFLGIAKDPWGNRKAGFSLNGKFNRRDWGLTWNAVLESGGVLVSDEVRINADLQMMQQN